MIKSLLLLCAGVFSAGATPAQGTPAGPATYRLDFFHTGGKGTEVFAIDHLRLEPLPWPGDPSRAVDDGQWGPYRYEVRDADGRLLAARGYASVYGEWVTTDEATRSYGTLRESLRFPAPTKPGPVQVKLYKRDAQQVFQPVWEVQVDTAGMFVDRSTAPQLPLVAIEQHGPPAQKVDLLLVGDGYTVEQCTSKFRKDAERMTTALFRYEPFKRRRSDFNVWGLCPPAAEPGISRPSTNIHRANPAGATYDSFGSERYILTFDDRALREIASHAPYEFVTILANSATYGGGGIFNDYSTVAVDSTWADYLFVHEFGHHFAALADEYYTSPVAYAPPQAVVEPWEPNVTALLDKERLKWQALAKHSTPVPTPWPKTEFEAYQRDIQARRKQIRAENRPESDMDALFREERDHEQQMFAKERYRLAVGAFQGANYDAQTYYRPQLDCIMFSRNDVPFCRVCEAAIEHVIDGLVGPATAH